MNRDQTFCTGRDCKLRQSCARYAGHYRPSYPVYIMNPTDDMKRDCKLYKEIQHSNDRLGEDAPINRPIKAGGGKDKTSPHS